MAELDSRADDWSIKELHCRRTRQGVHLEHIDEKLFDLRVNVEAIQWNQVVDVDINIRSNL